MNLTRLPNPPSPDSYLNQSEWAEAVYDWMVNVKNQIENDSTANTQPIGPYVVGTYTQTNTVTGTDALSNFVATLVTGLQQQGITAPTTPRVT